MANLSSSTIAEILIANIRALRNESPFCDGEVKYALDDSGEPDVKVAAANVPLDYDLWDGLRNPAGVGLHPARLQDIWEFYAWRTASIHLDGSGQETIFEVPRSFDYARGLFKRVLIVSVMLPFDEKLLKAYDRFIREHKRGASWQFSRFYEQVNGCLDKAILRTGMALSSEENVVLAMDRKTMDELSREGIPQVHQGDAHGPQKEVHFPQKSIAVLTGLAQFGVSRFVFRDELQAGRVKRFLGPIRSLVIFDGEVPVVNGSLGIIYPHQRWRDFLFSLSDFTITEREINRHRFCSYIPLRDKGCGKCIPSCPPKALIHSVPDMAGHYSEDLHERKRFWKDQLQFDYERCRNDRKKMATLFPEWRCGRCITVCAAEGNRRRSAVKNFEKKKQTLAIK